MLTVDIATNVLATALWELCLAPLFRGENPLQRKPTGRGRKALDLALRKSARDLANADRSTKIRKESWEDFFTSDAVRGLVRDVFIFRMDSREPSLGEIELAFRGEWSRFCEAEGVAAVDHAAYVFAQLVESANAVLDAAIRDDILSAHEAKSSARHRVVLARLEDLERAVNRQGSHIDEDALTRFETDLRTEVGARYSQIEPPNVFGRERVEIDQLYVAPMLGMPRGPESYEALALPGFLTTLDRRVVLGHPGAGKSTLAAKTCHTLATSYSDGLVGSRQLTPWIVELRRFAAAQDEKRQSLVEFFASWAATSYELDVPDGAFEALLARGRLLVVFDGLDELLDTSLRQDVRNQVESFCRRYVAAPVLVTSRVVGYNHAPLDGAAFDVVRLLDFDEERVGAYAAKWFDLRFADESSASRRKRRDQFMVDSAVASELRKSPLLLALLAQLHRGPGSIPKNLPDVYDRCANLLFSTWDKERDIDVRLAFTEHVRPALRELAWWIFNSSELSSDGVTRRQAVERTTAYLTQRRFSDEDEARAAAEDFVDFCRGRAWVFSDQGSTALGEDLFGFTHRTFLEFFAAEHLAYRRQTAEELVEELAPRFLKEQWDVVSQIALQIKAKGYPEGADDVARALYQILRPARGSELRAGVRFLLRILQAMIPSPPVTKSLGANLTGFAVREVRRVAARDGEILETLQLFAAIAEVGDEVQAELGRGAAEAVVSFLRQENDAASRLGSEILFRAERWLRPYVPESVYTFWEAIIGTVLHQFDDDVARAISVKLDVAVDAWPTSATVDDLLRYHPVTALFRRRRLELARVRTISVAAQLLELAYGSKSEPSSVDALATIGKHLRDQPLPWAAVRPRALSDCFDMLRAASHTDNGRPDDSNVLFGTWCLVALTAESEFAQDRRAPRALETSLRATQHPTLEVCAKTLSARWGETPEDLDGLIGVWGFSDDDRQIVRTWCTRTVSLLTIVEGGQPRR